MLIIYVKLAGRVINSSIQKSRILIVLFCIKQTLPLISEDVLVPLVDILTLQDLIITRQHAIPEMVAKEELKIKVDKQLLTRERSEN